MLIPFDFEVIKITQTAEVTRSKVPGGWLVTIVANSPRGNTEMTTTFLSDPEWQWSVKA